MHVIDLVQTDYYRIVFGVSAATLLVLRIEAGKEMARAWRYDPLRARNILGTPGAFGIRVAGERVLARGKPSLRFFHPSAYFNNLCLEPTLLLWYVAAWFMLFQDWRHAGYWAIGALLWRFTLDLLLDPAPAVTSNLRVGHVLVKCIWACASGLFFASLSAAVIALLWLLCLLAFAGGSDGNRRKRRSW